MVSLIIGNKLLEELIMNNIFRLWGENGFIYLFNTNADEEVVEDAIEYVKENIEEYDNEDVTKRLTELGYEVTVIHIPEQNSFYW